MDLRIDVAEPLHGHFIRCHVRGQKNLQLPPPINCATASLELACHISPTDVNINLLLPLSNQVFVQLPHHDLILPLVI